MKKLTPAQIELFTSAAIRCALLQVPFRHHGRWECEGLRGHKTGLDCAGIGLHCAVKAGVPAAELYDQMVYGRTATEDSLKKMVQANCGQPVAAEPSHGMVGLFAQYHDPGHMGIFVSHAGQLKLVHADNIFNKVVMQTYSKEHSKMLIEVYQP